MNLPRTIAPLPTSSKPVLINMNNPTGGYPLWPEPTGGIGYALWKMTAFFTGCTADEYKRIFDRICMTQKRRWDPKDARLHWPDILPTLKDRRVVVIGSDTLKCMGQFSRARYYRWVENDGFKWIMIPKPGGPIFQDPLHTLVSSSLLAELYNEYRLV